MRVTRRCPLCDKVTTMDIDDWGLEMALKKNKWGHIDVVEGKFYRTGTCEECQNVIYRAKKEVS